MQLSLRPGQPTEIAAIRNGRGLGGFWRDSVLGRRGAARGDPPSAT